jgi:hypothetical protein
MKSLFSLFAVPLVLVACQAQRDLTRSKPDTKVAKVGSVAATLVASSGTERDADTSASVGKAGVITVGTVTVDRNPYCQSTPSKGTNAWLANPQSQRQVEVLGSAVEQFEGDHVGTVFENDPNIAVVVMNQDFAQFGVLQKRLAGMIAPMTVQLRPACHSRAELNKAKEVLSARKFHPKAGSTAMSWYLDASFAGFVVHVDEAAPEVAAALRTQLGALIRVLPGKPPSRVEPGSPSSPH